MPKIYFAKQTSQTGADGVASYTDTLWVSNGTAASAHAAVTFAAVTPPATNPAPDDIERITSAGDRIAFYAPQRSGGSYASAVYMSDGTAAGTIALTSPDATGGGPILSASSSRDGDLLFANGALYFGADHVDAGTGSMRTGLFGSDGTVAGTHYIGSNNSGPHNYFSDFTTHDGTIYFVASEGSGDIFSSDGETETKFIRRANADPSFAVLGDTVYGLGSANYNRVPKDVLIDASTGAIIKNLGFANNLVAFDDTLYFTGYAANSGVELWSVDPATAVAGIAVDIAAGSASSDPFGLTVWNGKLYFNADTAATGDELFWLDGAGGIHSQDIVPGAEGSDPYDFTPFDNALFFDAKGGIYKIDDAGHVTLVIAGLTLEDAQVYGGRLYFLSQASSGDNPTYDLYSTDGSAAGTTQIAADVERNASFDIVAGSATRTPGDFNGDGHSDILWRNDDGNLTEWQVGGDTGQLTPNAYGNAGVGTDWHVAETFDFNGDGLSDILWRNAGTGQFTVWEGAAGGFTQNVYSDTSVGRDWQIAAVGDLDGDGKDDIVWHNTATGTITTWLSTGTGFSENVAVYQDIPLAYQIVGTGDFNGDGKADLLWRDQTTGQFTTWDSNGQAFDTNVYTDNSVGTDWHVQAIADFDGDGKSDLLWRNAASGEFTIWTSTGTGFTPNTYVDTSVGSDWRIAQTGDFNGDGKADILWRNTATGTFTLWQSNGHGFDENVAVQTGVGTDWHVQGHEYLYG